MPVSRETRFVVRAGDQIRFTQLTHRQRVFTVTEITALGFKVRRNDSRQVFSVSAYEAEVFGAEHVFDQQEDES